jgi:hypothetical protein
MKALGLKIKNSTLYKVVLEEVKEEFMSIKYVSLQWKTDIIRKKKTIVFVRGNSINYPFWRKDLIKFIL